MHPARSLLVVAVAAVALAGCFGSEAVPNERTVEASNGKASAGWAYDGAGVTPGKATLSGRVQNAENAGSVLVGFEFAGSQWAVDFSTFKQAEGKDFMDGGVAFDLTEHGDSGVADASIPKILARIAAWGTATVTRDGEVLKGASGSESWSAHLMVSDTTVRDASGKIAKADGSAYDPKTPGDATRTEGDPQALFWIKSPDGETAKREAVPVTGAVEIAGPDGSGTVDVPATKGAAVALNVTAGGGAAPVGVGTVTFELIDAEGNVLQSAEGTVTPQGPFLGSLVAESAPGPLQVRITGAGAYRASVEGTIAFDDHPFLVLTWDDVTLS